MKMFAWIVLCAVLGFGASAVGTDEVSAVSVMEGDSVTLNTSVTINPKDRIKWYFNNIRIAEINKDQNKICTDVQCNEGTERFRNRLKLDHQTGSLTIMNTRNTDSGLYQLEIISSGQSNNIGKSFTVNVTDVFVMEGDSVTLHTDVKMKQQDKIKWYYNDIRIAQINGDLNKMCTDVQCNEGTESFRDRLKLDHVTGSLNITNINIKHAGLYKLQIITSGSGSSENTFNVSVRGVPAAEQVKLKTKSVKEGESVTLDPCVTKKTNYVMKWYFNDVLITEITGDQSKICTDDQCDEKFRDRLKLDHQTGSLTINNTRITDSGDYKLEISSSRFSVRRRRRSTSITSVRSFSVTVIDSDLKSDTTGRSAAVVTGIVGVGVGVLLAAAAAALIYYRHYRNSRPATQNDNDVL